MKIIFSKDISCEKCPLQFGNRTVLNMHMRLVHNNEAKSTNTEKAVKLENENCDQQSLFKSRDIYSEQTIYVHEKKKSLKCKFCDKMFSKRCNFTRHVTALHEGKETF